MEFENALRKARQLAKKYVQSKPGYRLHPNEEQVEGLLREMALNHVEFGARYCPCMTKRITGDKEVDAKMKLLKEKGLDQWLQIQESAYKCKKCGTVFTFFQTTCNECGAEVSSHVAL